MSGSSERIRVLGIDPGSYSTGWGMLGGTPAKPTVIDCGRILLERRLPFWSRLASLHAAVVELLERFEPENACVEALFHGVNARSALQLAHARGVVLAALAAGNVEITEISPATVKRTVVGSGRADKSQVEAMVRRLLKPTQEIVSTDVSDALAIAYCHVAGHGMRSAVSRAVTTGDRRSR